MVSDIPFLVSSSAFLEALMEKVEDDAYSPPLPLWLTLLEIRDSITTLFNKKPPAVKLRRNDTFEERLSSSGHQKLAAPADTVQVVLPSPQRAQEVPATNNVIADKEDGKTTSTVPGDGDVQAYKPPPDSTTSYGPPDDDDWNRLNLWDGSWDVEDEAILAANEQSITVVPAVEDVHVTSRPVEEARCKEEDYDDNWDLDDWGETGTVVQSTNPTSGHGNVVRQDCGWGDRCADHVPSYGRGRPATYGGRDRNQSTVSRGRGRPEWSGTAFAGRSESFNPLFVDIQCLRSTRGYIIKEFAATDCRMDAKCVYYLVKSPASAVPYSGRENFHLTDMVHGIKWSHGDIDYDRFMSLAWKIMRGRKIHVRGKEQAEILLDTFRRLHRTDIREMPSGPEGVEEHCSLYTNRCTFHRADIRVRKACAQYVAGNLCREYEKSRRPRKYRNL